MIIAQYDQETKKLTGYSKVHDEFIVPDDMLPVPEVDEQTVIDHYEFITVDDTDPQNPVLVIPADLTTAHDQLELEKAKRRANLVYKMWLQDQYEVGVQHDFGGGNEVLKAKNRTDVQILRSLQGRAQAAVDASEDGQFRLLLSDGCNKLLSPSEAKEAADKAMVYFDSVEADYQAHVQNTVAYGTISALTNYVNSLGQKYEDIYANLSDVGDVDQEDSMELEGSRIHAMLAAYLGDPNWHKGVATQTGGGGQQTPDPVLPESYPQKMVINGWSTMNSGFAGKKATGRATNIYDIVGEMYTANGLTGYVVDWLFLTQGSQYIDGANAENNIRTTDSQVAIFNAYGATSGIHMEPTDADAAPVADSNVGWVTRMANIGQIALDEGMAPVMYQSHGSVSTKADWDHDIINTNAVLARLPQMKVIRSSEIINHLVSAYPEYADNTYNDDRGDTEFTPPILSLYSGSAGDGFHGSYALHYLSALAMFKYLTGITAASNQFVPPAYYEMPTDLVNRIKTSVDLIQDHVFAAEDIPAQDAGGETNGTTSTEIFFNLGDSGGTAFSLNGYDIYPDDIQQVDGKYVNTIGSGGDGTQGNVLNGVFDTTGTATGVSVEQVGWFKKSGMATGDPSLLGDALYVDNFVYLDRDSTDGQAFHIKLKGFNTGEQWNVLIAGENYDGNGSKVDVDVNGVTGTVEADPVVKFNQIVTVDINGHIVINATPAPDSPHVWCVISGFKLTKVS